MQIHKGIIVAVIIIVCLFTYFNTFFADFVWDDILYVSNPCMQSFKFLPLFFSNDFWKFTTETVVSQYYRPFYIASFMLDYYIWGSNPFGFTHFR